MEYLKQSNRLNAYIRYVHNLVEQQTKLKNYAKAGMILLLHCQLLEWKHIPVTASSGKSKETQFDLKSKLYSQAIDLFEKGKYFEKAISLSQELGKQLKTQKCDYLEVVSLLEREASLYQSVSENKFLK